MPAVAATNPPVLIAMVAAATVADPGRLRRRDAAEPRPAGGRRAVRAARGGVPRPDRPRASVGRRAATRSPAGRCGTVRVASTTRRSTASPSTSRNVIAMLEPGRRRPRRAAAAPTRCGRPRSRPRRRRSGCSAPPTTPRAWRPRRACPTSSRTTSPAAARPRRWRSTATGSAVRPAWRPPTTFLTANVVVAETDEEAERLARPQLLAMLALRTGGELAAAAAGRGGRGRRRTCPSTRSCSPAMRRRWLVGSPTGWPAPVRDARRTVRRRRGDGAPGRRCLRRHRRRRLPGPRGVAAAARQVLVEADAD